MLYIKLFSYAINLFASIATLTIGILSMDAFSIVAIVFLVWAISPYLFAMLIIKRCTQHRQLMIIAGLASIQAIAGIWVLIDMMYLQQDAQSALAFVVIPMYQWLVLLIIAVLNYAFNRKHL